MRQFNPLSKSDINQLSSAVGYSSGRLEIFRTNRLQLMREYVGSHYSENGASDKVPVNLLELAVNIYLQKLVAQAPKVTITTPHRKLKEICTRFELATNQLIEEINLDEILEQAVSGAMFSMGAIKVGMNRSKVEIGGYLHDSGQPFADFVGLDDWVHDMTVTNFQNGQFEGNYWTCTLDEALEYFGSNAHDKLTPTEEQIVREDDHSISEGPATQREEFRDTVRLLDLWLPKQNLLLQCQATDNRNDPIKDVLNIVEWEGPERGPYHKLGFGKVENNTMPTAPAMHLRDLHELTNSLFRKLGRQANREKTILGVQRGSEADGNRVVDANDGEAIAMDNPQAAHEYRYGGISQESLGFLIQTKELFSYLAGNLDMIGGLGPQSETLGQDQLLSASASMRIRKMQKKVYQFTQGVVEDLCHYLWTDPYTVLPLTKRVKGFEDVAVNVNFGPADREGDFLAYNINIEPYSMQAKSPEEKLMSLRTIFAEFVAPLLPMMAQQGVTVDVEMLFRKISKLGSIPEIEDILNFSSPNHETEPFGEMPAKASITTRRYERVNRPGATNHGKAQIMQQALFGGKPQNSETASLTRATG